MEEKLWTVADVAYQLSLGKSTVRKHITTGVLPAPLRVGNGRGTFRWEPERLKAWVRDGCPNGSQWDKDNPRASAGWKLTVNGEA